MDIKNRYLKVYQSYNNNNKPIPEIRLKGQWLQAVGFIIGSDIAVQCFDNQIVIKKEKDIESKLEFPK